MSDAFALRQHGARFRESFAHAEAIRRNTNGVRDVLSKDLGFNDLDFIDSENGLMVIEIDPIRPDNEALTTRA